jgi:hypothetical protein
MNTTFSDISIAILFVAVAAFLIMWLRYKFKMDSFSRMYRMMARIGVYPGKFSGSESESGLDMQAVRSRCRMCPAEDACERWLAGEIDGDNGFCPNAKVFDGVLKAS